MIAALEQRRTRILLASIILLIICLGFFSWLVSWLRHRYRHQLHRMRRRLRTRRPVLVSKSLPDRICAWLASRWKSGLACFEYLRLTLGSVFRQRQHQPSIEEGHKVTSCGKDIETPTLGRASSGPKAGHRQIPQEQEDGNDLEVIQKEVEEEVVEAGLLKTCTGSLSLSASSERREGIDKLPSPCRQQQRPRSLPTPWTWRTWTQPRGFSES